LKIISPSYKLRVQMSFFF